MSRYKKFVEFCISVRARVELYGPLQNRFCVRQRKRRQLSECIPRQSITVVLIPLFRIHVAVKYISKIFRLLVYGTVIRLRCTEKDILELPEPLVHSNSNSFPVHAHLNVVLKVVVEKLRHFLPIRSRLSKPSEYHPNVETEESVLGPKVILQMECFSNSRALAVLQHHLQQRVRPYQEQSREGKGKSQARVSKRVRKK